MFKKFATVFSIVLLLLIVCTNAFAEAETPDDIVRKEEIYLTYAKKVDSAEICYNNGVNYNSISANEYGLLIPFADGKYVITFKAEIDGDEVIGTLFLYKDEFDVIVEEHCDTPTIETYTITNHWRWKDSHQSSSISEEVAYKLILPCHAINLNE